MHPSVCDVCNATATQEVNISKLSFVLCDNPFCLWRARVEHQLQTLFHIGRDDMPDAPYYSWYRRGYTPVRAARAAVRNASTY